MATYKTEFILPAGASRPSNSTPSFLTGTVLDANPNRVGLFIQNLSASGLYVKYGEVATSDSFNEFLAGATASGDADGGKLNQMPAYYRGPVSVRGPAPYYIAWEL